ncbi:MAG TPA: hypothetical protein PLS95_19930 [Thermoanaerobaculales bacterium]|nr:hypothetical protein [Thermoanaerobaculales bacterium]
MSHLASWDRVYRPMNAIPTPPASAAAPATESAEERHADRERRLDEAASILAVTLLDMWRRERCARREAASGGAS